VIVADDDPLARMVIRETLQRAGIVVVADVGSGIEVADLAVHYRPDVVLMDLAMPDGDGLSATRRIAENAPEVSVIVLTASDDDAPALAALRAGAVGYLRKGPDLRAIPHAIEAVCRGEAVISPRMSRLVLDELRRTRQGSIGMRPVHSVLTPREWEVLDLLANKVSTEEMAETLVLSLETVRSHVKAILRKLGVNSREAAVAAAEQMRSGVR
jgi:DNA-binding NarL/FixJ family response regulator